MKHKWAGKHGYARSHIFITSIFNETIKMEDFTSFNQFILVPIVVVSTYTLVSFDGVVSLMAGDDTLRTLDRHK